MGVHGDAWNELLESNGRLFREKWKADPELDRSAARALSLELNAAGRDALAEGEVAGALKSLLEAVHQCPELAENYNDLGAVLWEIGETRRAVAMFRRALALNPQYAEAQENLDAAGASMNVAAAPRNIGE
jgi:Flp pilus assembly protein TadD